MVEKNWTYEQVKAAQDAARAAGEPDGPTLPLYRWVALQKMDQLQVSYDNGDKMALFAALRICANHDLVMPEWVSRAFIRGYDKVLNCRAGSWDEAFDRPYPKGKHLSGMREDRQKRLAVHIRVRELVEREQLPIDDGLFERVGAEFGIGKTRTNRLYYEAEDMLPRNR